MASPKQAEACGGLFCDQNNGAVNQTAERIIFSDNGDGTVTSVVQILYSGPADEFSWILPVPGIPDVKVSSNTAFTRLQNATNPNYTLNQIIEGECADDLRATPNAESEDFDSAGDPEQGAENNGGVTVVDSGSAGPYDYEVIAVDPDLEDPADVAVAWLDDNGYDVTAIGPDVLRPYLEEGKNLIAFRLQKSADSGSIRPVMLTYESDHPCIPIRPTAVAVEEDMSIMTFVLGATRAIPINYRHLEINEAVLNWFNPNTNYTDVVSLAADEAGGQGFVTEFAGDAGAFEETIFGEFDNENWDELRNQDWSNREGELLSFAASLYQGFDGMRETISEAVPLPENVTLDEFLGCIFCFDLVDQNDIEGFEAEVFIAAVETHIVTPMQETQALLDASPYMTRMLTSMSGREMTVDPGFLFNPDLADVSNVHTADQFVECTPDVSQFEAPWRVVLPQGGVVRGQGRVWPIDTDADMPANREIRQMDSEGSGEVVSDNNTLITQAIERSNANFPAPSPAVEGGNIESCACQSPARPAQLPASVLLVLCAAIGVLRLRS
jgi:hypothetical protein